MISPTAPKMATTATLSSVMVYGIIIYVGGQYFASLVQTPMPGKKTKVKISRKLRKVIKSAPCSSKTLTSTRVRHDGKLTNKQKQSVVVNLAAPACQRKVRTTLRDNAFKDVKDPITRRQLIDGKIRALQRMVGKKQRRKVRRPRRAFVSPEEAASVAMGRSINYGALRPEVQRQ